MKNASVIILKQPNTASATGSAFNVGQIVSASFVPTMGDTAAAGTIKIQCSNDNPNVSGKGTQLGTPFIPANWADIPNATSSITAGVGSAIVIPNMCFYFIRAVYTSSIVGSSTVLLTMNELSP